jgi:drug/metabolite transporter (DMT)-like permease
VGGVYASRTFRGVPPLTMAIGQQAGASMLLLPFAAIALPRAHFSTPAFLSLLGLALLSTAVAYLIYYPLIKQVGPTRTLSVTFLIPLFGLMWGAVFLHEHVGPGTVLGLLIILSSITLITGVRFRPARAAQEPAPRGR